MNKIWRSIQDYDFLDNIPVSKDVENKLIKRFEIAKDIFLEYIDKYQYKIIDIDKYGVVYIINDKYAIFIGVLCDNPQAGLRNIYIDCSDDEYINRNFAIFIEELVYDDELSINIDEFINKLDNIYNCYFVQGCQVYQYFERDDTNKYPQYYSDDEFFKTHLLVFDNNDKFHSIAKKILSDVNLYKLLRDNQNNQSIDSNYDIHELIEYYDEVLKLVEKGLEDLSFRTYDINDYEKVLLVEDSLVLYVGAKGKNALFLDKNKQNGNVVDRYSIVIQKLTFNEVFDKKKFKKYLNDIHILTGSYVGAEKYNNINYRPFSIGDSDEKILKGYHPRFYNNSNFDYVNNKIPELRLQERYNTWKGQLRYYIVYEFIYYKDKIGYAVASTLNPNPRMIGRNIMHQYESNGGYLMYFSGIYYDESWGNLISKFVEEQKNSHWDGYKHIGEKSSLFAEKVQYFIVPYYVNNINIHHDIVGEIVLNAKSGKYKDFDRTLYDISEYKWKSEELMYKCVKKIFKNKNVIHQYNPFFLGKQTYDVFVCGRNIAFEYQGEQHFKPIELFGGEKAFEENKKRDQRKLELSKKNGIELIYIKYWEDVTVNLIKEKLDKKGIKY